MWSSICFGCVRESNTLRTLKYYHFFLFSFPSLIQFPQVAVRALCVMWTCDRANKRLWHWRCVVCNCRQVFFTLLYLHFNIGATCIVPVFQDDDDDGNVNDDHHHHYILKRCMSLLRGRFNFNAVCLILVVIRVFRLLLEA